jgi:hypothetical protein
MCRVKTNETAGKKGSVPARKDALQLSAIRKALPEEGALIQLSLYDLYDRLKLFYSFCQEFVKEFILPGR